MTEKPQTWHYGLVARYWAECIEEGGQDVDYFRQVIETHGQPALDVGCGTGRLLLSYLRAGLDVDGSDISPDMIAFCREKATQEGFSPQLYAQASHELDLSRSYKTIIVCGSFGIGGQRHQDVEALRRFYDLLEPGGVLALDQHLPDSWKYWKKEDRQQLPEEWPPLPPPEAGNRLRDGSQLDIGARTVAFDRLELVKTMEMRALLWREGELVEEEIHPLKTRIYLKNEMLMMLEQAGFRHIQVQGDHTGEEATAEHGVLVFIAQK